VTLAQDSPCRLAHDGIGLRLEIIEGFAIGQPGAELIGLGPQLSIGECLDRGLESIDGLRQDLELLEFLAFADVKDLLEYRHGEG
jgi:hypothetical protein